jgi:hypothetical protein
MEKEATPLVAMNFDLPARKEFVAAGANAPLIERRPFAVRIAGSENVQAIFRGEMLLHVCTKGPHARPRNRAQG